MKIFAGGSGELTTPTGMALVSTLAERCEDLPLLTLHAAGAGAGTRDTPGQPNLTRVLIGERVTHPDDNLSEADVLIEANVDDLDPRLWPGVLTSLIRAGAADAWLVPIIMKKGRPAHTVSVLARPDQAADLRYLLLSLTSTIGVRETESAQDGPATGMGRFDHRRQLHINQDRASPRHDLASHARVR